MYLVSTITTKKNRTGTIEQQKVQCMNIVLVVLFTMLSVSIATGVMIDSLKGNFKRSGIIFGVVLIILFIVCVYVENYR